MPSLTARSAPPTAPPIGSDVCNGTLFTYNTIHNCLHGNMPHPLLQVCVRTMSQCDSVLPMIAAMKSRPDHVLLAAETLRRMFDHKIPELVSQVIQGGEGRGGEGRGECCVSPLLLLLRH